MKKNNLLMIERMILESLDRDAQNLGELKEDTGLDYGLLNCLLGVLLQKDLIVYNRGKYSLSLRTRNGDFTDRKGVQEEVREILNSLLQKHFSNSQSPCLKVRKVWMSDKDFTLFQAQLVNLERFIDSLKYSDKQNCKTQHQRVVVWGVSEYGELMKEALKAA